MPVAPRIDEPHNPAISKSAPSRALNLNEEHFYAVSQENEGCGTAATGLRLDCCTVEIGRDCIKVIRPAEEWGRELAGLRQRAVDNGLEVPRQEAVLVLLNAIARYSARCEVGFKKLFCLGAAARRKAQRLMRDGFERSRGIHCLA